jgi:2-desacetyl-2-hydroxyethyl bacteriochlorophyllide A dehydrogenase
MLAAQIIKPGQTRVVEVGAPEPGPDEVAITVRAAGVCGTDIHILKGEYEADYPLIPGHEFSGVVAAAGANVTRFKVGDRVTADPNIPCNRCAFCQRNEPNQCLHLKAVGVTRDGAFAQRVVVHEGNVFAIGDLSFAAAALIEPLACVAWGLIQVAVQPSDTALIFGAGPMGCLLAQAVKACGASQVVITDVAPKRLALAATLGVTETVLADAHQAQRLRELAPDGYEVVVDVTGVPAVMEQMIHYARPRGKLWLFGVAPRGTSISLSPYEIFRRDLKVIGSFAVNRTFPQAIAMIRSGAVNVEPLVSHQLPLAEFGRGLDLAQHDPERMKVQFSM